MERLFGAIPAVLKDLGENPGATEAVVFAAWKDCAGELITERTEPVEYFEERLVVAVQDATWRMHLEDLSPQMIARLNSTLGQGSVKFIEFRIDPSAFKERPAKADRSEEISAAEVPLSLAEAAKAITDEELRKSFLSAAAAYLEKK